MEKRIDHPDMGEEEYGSNGSATEFKRWSLNRKKEAVLRMMRGEPMDVLSRELSIDVYRLEEWHERALQGIEGALKRREGDPYSAELDAAMRCIGEISLENELLRDRMKKQIKRKSKK